MSSVRDDQRRAFGVRASQPQFTDKTLHCVECDEDFIFEAGEQFLLQR